MNTPRLEHCKKKQKKNKKKHSAFNSPINTARKRGAQQNLISKHTQPSFL